MTTRFGGVVDVLVQVLFCCSYHHPIRSFFSAQFIVELFTYSSCVYEYFTIKVDLKAFNTTFMMELKQIYNEIDWKVIK